MVAVLLNLFKGEDFYLRQKLTIASNRWCRLSCIFLIKMLFIGILSQPILWLTFLTYQRRGCQGRSSNHKLRVSTWQTLWQAKLKSKSLILVMVENWKRESWLTLPIEVIQQLHPQRYCLMIVPNNTQIKIKHQITEQMYGLWVSLFSSCWQVHIPLMATAKTTPWILKND